MSVQVNDQNLGHATAYGYASSKGYTGTEDEFAELMASYADVAEQAAESATQAAASATTASTKAGEASTSASNAATSATTASTAATTATTKAGEASTSASTASTKASEATTAAATATTKAGEASTSATNAAGSATTASTAATTATTKASEAAASATAAAASAASLVIDDTLTHAGQAADAKKTGDEISSLKDGINSLSINPTLYEGYFTENGILQPPTQYNERYTEKIGCVPNQKFTITVTLPSANGLQLFVVEYDKDGKFVRRYGGGHGWIATWTEEYTVPTDVYSIIVVFRQFTGGTLSIICTNWAKFMTTVNLPSETAVRDFHLENSAYQVSVRGINHSGWYEAPENTIPAFKASKKQGFSFVETDVQFTSDNVPVLMHDTTINRTGRNSDGTSIDTTITVSNATYQELLQYDFGIYKGAQYAGTKIGTLEDLIVLCKNLNMHPYLEMKANWTSQKAQIALNIVDKYNMRNRVTWISSSATFLSNIAKIDKRARLGLILLTGGITSSVIETVNSLYTEHNSVFISANYSNISSADIETANTNKIPVEVYTVNDLQIMLALDSYINGVTSDIYNYEQELVKEATAS